jgi:predicted ATPase
VTLIDALYEHKVKLLAAADAQPDRSTPEALARSNSSAPRRG